MDRTPFWNEFAQNTVGSLIDWLLPGGIVVDKIDFGSKGFKGGEDGKFIPVVRSNAAKDLGKIVPILRFELFYGSGNIGGCLSFDADRKIVAGQPLYNGEHHRLTTAFSAQHRVRFPVSKGGSVRYFRVAFLKGFLQKMCSL